MSGPDTGGTSTSGGGLPQGITERLKGLIRELEEQDTESARAGEIELKISEDEALWYVAYKTAAE